MSIAMHLSKVIVRFSIVLGFAFAGAFPVAGHAGEVRIAAASNFADSAREIATLFEMASGHTVIMSFGSTGQIYAQITQGAPFDIFLAADQRRPALIETEGYADPGARFTYAVGRLVLYSADPTTVTGEESLATEDFEKIAIANPVTAPYGAAAMETLKGLGLYQTLRAKIVQGNTITQTYQFVASGNAGIGIVALSQIARHRMGSRWLVPKTLHSPIAQDGVLLKRGAENDAAHAFVAYMKGPIARSVMQKFGYEAGDSP